MFLDGGELPRVRLPVDFDGPTCAKCKHADVPDRRKNWKCRAGEPELVSEWSTDPVTGDVTDPVYDAVDCVRRNRNGDCELFEAKREPPGLPLRPYGSQVDDPMSAITSELEACIADGRRPKVNLDRARRADVALDANVQGPGGWLRRLFRWLFT